MTACCHAITTPSAVLIGAVGGIVMEGAQWVLNRRRIDDAISAVPVHLAAGIWGTVAVALFGNPVTLGTGLSRWAQLQVQLTGVCGAFVLTFGTTYLLLRLINKVFPLRVTAEQEEVGLNVAEHGAATELTTLIAEMDGHRKTGDFLQPVSFESFTEVGQIAEQYNQVLAVINSERRQLLDSNQRVSVANAELVEAQWSVEQKLQELADFNDMAVDREIRMIDEIRTPMTAILGFSEVLLGKDGPSNAAPERVNALETIQRNGKYLLQLINDILDLSKIEAHKLQVERIVQSPVRLVDDVAALMRVRAEAKGLPLAIEYAGRIPETIQSDPTRLRQILINLVGNAIKFTEKGQIRIVTRLSNAVGRRPSLQIEVIDTGIGMSRDQMKSIFQPFTQADVSTTREFGGTGLGLTISKRLAELLGGDITISSCPCAGSTFTVTVDTRNLDGVQMLQNVTETVPTTSQTSNAAVVCAVKLDCRLLLVEDGPDNQRLISFVMQKAGAHVTIAGNGRIAMDLVLAARDRGESFDVVLMDMQMPVMDGYEATRNLRAEGCTVPIIALTAHAMSHDRKKCIVAGCDDYATKPINREQLISLVASYSSQQTTTKMADASC